MSNPLAALPLRAARWSATHPWRAILAWFVFVLVAVGLAVAIPTQETTDADYRLGESGRADQLIHEAQLESPDSEHVLITAPGDDRLDQSLALSAAEQLRDDLAPLDGVTTVSEPQWSADDSALLLSVQLARDHEDISALLAATENAQADFPELDIRGAGDVSLDQVLDKQVEDDLAAAEGISLPVTLVLMLLAFGALIAAGLPVLLAATSVAATIGLSAPLSHLIHAESTVASMIVLIGMAVGVDYSLFYLKRERQERAAGRTTLDAVEIAAETSGHSILVSGGAVIASLAGLFVLEDTTFNSLAMGAILVVAIAVLGSITVLPALLVKLGRWVDRPRVPLLWRVNRKIGQGGVSGRMLAPVVRHPVAALTLSSVAVLALALPGFGMKIHSANLDTLPQDIREVQTFQQIAEEFPAEGATASLVVKAPPSEAEAVRQALTRLEADAIVAGQLVDSGAQSVTSDDGTTTLLEVALPYEESDPRLDDVIADLRTTPAADAFDDLGAEYVVGGGSAEGIDWVAHLKDRLAIVIGCVLLLTTLMMGFSFRSAWIAGVSLLLNLVSVGVAFGVLTLVFQHGWFAGALDFTSAGFVIEWLPVLIMVILVGLSMDYQVFVLSRIQEHVRRGLPTRLAVESGIRETAGVVTSAATVMVSVFAIFATLSLLEMKMMGVGLSVAILVDATIIRLVMLPAILVLLGDRAWWPRGPGRPAGERVVESEPGYELVGSGDGHRQP
jgi:RND superfamily putative drug exporter